MLASVGLRTGLGDIYIGVTTEGIWPFYASSRHVILHMEILDYNSVCMLHHQALHMILRSGSSMQEYIGMTMLTLGTSDPRKYTQYHYQWLSHILDIAIELSNGGVHRNRDINANSLYKHLAFPS